MTLDWTDFPDAPAPGTFVCPLTDIRPNAVLSLLVAEFPLLVASVEGDVTAYVNACPHQFLPLDQRSSSLLSEDGTRRMCSNHQAEFDLRTGAGIAGFGLGCALSPVPVRCLDSALVIGT